MIKKATLDDIEVFRPMIEMFAAEAHMPTNVEDCLDSIEFFIESEDHIVLLDSEHRGLAIATVVPLYFNRSIKIVQEAALWVHKDHRRSSIGSKLRKGLELWGATRGAKASVMVALESAAVEAATSSYEKDGYALLEQHYWKNL